MRRTTPQSSLPGRLVTLIGLAFFTVEVVILVVFTVFTWQKLKDDRRAELVSYVFAVQDRARAALLGTRSGDDADVNRELDAALRDPQASGEGGAFGAGTSLHHAPADATHFRVWVFTRDGARRLTPAGQLLTSEERPWRGPWPREVERFLAGSADLAPVEVASPGVLARVEPIPSGSDEPPAGVLYVSSDLSDLQRQVATYGLTAFVTGGIALFVTALITIGYLRRALLHPLAVIVRADNAARRGRDREAVIDEGEIPDDELGEIMRSRNALLANLFRAQRDLDEKNHELQRWGQDLERLVREKTDALLRARDRLHRTHKLAALGRMAANVAHEINNPLACIAGYAEEAREELARGGGDGDLQEALRTIEEQAFRCKEILSRLLSLVRADRVEHVEVDLGRLVEETVALSEPAARKRGVDLRLDAPAEGPTIESDPGYLQQVILNLIENAVDAASRQGAGGGSWVRASVREPEGAGTVQVVVSDSGQGIAPEEARRIFDPYYTTKPVGRGTGLGLAISQTLVERLGGSIGLESAPGEGATFVVTLPRAQPVSGDGPVPRVVVDTSFMESHVGGAAGASDPDA